MFLAPASGAEGSCPAGSDGALGLPGQNSRRRLRLLRPLRRQLSPAPPPPTRRLRRREGRRIFHFSLQRAERALGGGPAKPGRGAEPKARCRGQQVQPTSSWWELSSSPSAPPAPSAASYRRRHLPQHDAYGVARGGDGHVSPSSGRSERWGEWRLPVWRTLSRSAWSWCRELASAFRLLPNHLRAVAEQRHSRTFARSRPYVGFASWGRR